MIKLSPSEQLTVFTHYLGTTVWVSSSSYRPDEQQHRFGRLKGVNDRGILLEMETGSRLWFTIADRFPAYTFRLLLVPCSRLHPEVVATAQNLGVPGFIVPYYRSLGYDLPVFLAPEHPANVHNVVELGMADYRSKEEISPTPPDPAPIPSTHPILELLTVLR